MAEKESFLKLGIIYTIGQILSKIISFIMLPIYTRQLGAVGYGKLALADTVMDFISTFLIISIYSGYGRFYREYKKQDRKKLKNTTINFALILTIFDILFFLAFGETIAKFVFNFDNCYKILMLIVIRSLISQFITLFMCDYALNYKAMITVIINIFILIMNLGLSILFVVYRKQGVVGIYKGYIYSNSILLLYLIFKNIKDYRFELDKNMLKDMLSFSWGLIPINLSSTILTLADRYFLAGYKNYSETGIYSIAYKFGMLINPLIVDPFKSIFGPYKFQIWKDENAEEKFNNMFNKYHFLGCLIILSIAFYSRIFINIFTTNEYINAYKLVPLILFSYFLYGENEFYSLGIQIKNKTYLTGIIMLIAGTINIILNILFIPKIGMYGAAISTLISYIIINVINIMFSLPLYKVKYDFKNIFKLYFITLFLYCSYYLISIYNTNLFWEFIYNLILLALYVYLCLYFNIINMCEAIKYKNKFILKLKNSYRKIYYNR